MNTLNIAINTLGSSSLKTGTGQYVVNLVRQLAKIDSKNKYVLFVTKTNAHYFQNLPNNFRLIYCPFSNPILRSLWEHTKLNKYLFEEKIDILHAPGFVAPLRITTPYILTIFDMTFFTHPKLHLRKKVWYYQKLIPRSVRNARAVIADSESARSDIIQLLHTDPKKITTIHLGVSEEFRPLNKALVTKYLTQKWNIRQPYVLFVGTIEPRKNIPCLLEAFTNLKTPHQLIIVGGKGWKVDLPAEIEKYHLHQRVRYLGYVSDSELVHLYNGAEAFVYPSLYEGFGLPVIEAMACGCPVITSNNSSLKEIASDAALLIDPNKPEEITQALTILLTDHNLQKRLRIKRIQRAQAFSWKNTAQKTLELYEKICP